MGINIEIFDFKNNVWWQLGYFAAPPGTKISPPPPLRRKDPTGEEVSFSRGRSKLIRLIHQNITGLKQVLRKKIKFFI